MFTTLSLCLLGLVTNVEPPAAVPAPDATVQKPAAKSEGPYRVVRTLELGGEGGWDFVEVDGAAHRLYVPRSTHVMVIDTETGKQVGDIADTAGVHGVAIASEFGKGFTSNGKSNDVTVFDLATLKPIKNVAAGANPDAILFEPVTKRVFVFNGKSKDATVIAAADLSTVGTVPVGGKPEVAVADGRGKVFLNIEDTSELVRIDAKTMKVEARWPLSPGEGPSGLAIDAAHNRLFSVCSNEKMVVVDSENGNVMGVLPIGKGVDGAAFDPPGAVIGTGGFAISSNGEGTITVVGGGGVAKPYSVVQTLPTAARARTITVDPKTHFLYLPTAEVEPTPPGERAPARPKFKAGTFKVLVVGTAEK